MKQRETHASIVDQLQEMKNWLHKYYEAEAHAEICEAVQCGGDIQKMSRPRVSEDLCPGRFYVQFDSEAVAQVSGVAETVDYFG